MEAQATYKKNGYKKPEPDAGLEQYVFGKIQPQAVELEQAVLGALMMDRDALMLVADVLTPAAFYLESHQHIYRAISSLFAESSPVDILTTTERLKRDGTFDAAGGAYYVVELSHRVASAANIEYHSRVVFEKFVARSIIEVCTRSIREAYEETTDVFKLLDTLETGLMKTREGQASGSRKISEITTEVLKQAEAADNAKVSGGIVGIPSGITELDRETGGFRDSNLTIIAGRPGMGKSAMLNTIALNAALAGHPIGIFSLEMSSLELTQRVVSSVSRVNGRKLNSGGILDSEWQKMQTAIEKIETLPIYIDDTPAVNILQIRAKARRWKIMHGIKIILIDYLQLMSSADKSGNREQQVSEISRGLKSLAKELNVPVIALSQLSRAVETRGGSKRPMLSDLRESGAIEQDADNVLFLYRPEYYDILEDENGQNLAGLAEIIVAKNRHGRQCHAMARYTAEYTLFENIEVKEFETPNTHGPTPPPTSGGMALNNPFGNIPRIAEEDIPF